MANSEVADENNDAEKENEVATASNTSHGSHKETLNPGIDPNVCCMCFGNYEEDVLDGCGADWIDCACGRWLHVDCAEDCITDCHGNSRYCP